MSALTAVKSTDIAGVVRSMDVETLDVLMKYLYAGMAAPEKFNAGSLLAWHEVVRARARTAHPPTHTPRHAGLTRSAARTLHWGEPRRQVVESAGLASIVRVLTDRKTA